MSESNLPSKSKPASRSERSSEGSSRRRSGRGRGNESNGKNGDSKRENGGDGNRFLSTLFLWLGRAIIIGMVVISPWALGSVHAQSRFWLLAAAVVGLAMWWFSMVFSREAKYTVPYLAFPVILGLLMLGVQLTPLNESMASKLAPHQAELYEKYATPAPGELLRDVRNPIPPRVRITMDTDSTQQMFNLMLLGLVGLMAGCYFFSSRKAIYVLPIAMTINGVAISCFGFIRRIANETASQNIFGLELTQGGSPFGPYVNQNNAAGYLLLCLAASIAVLHGAFFRRPPASQRPRQIITREYPIWKQAYMNAALFVAELNAYKIAAMIGAIVICGGVVMTFSRGGIVAMTAASIVTATYYSLSKRSATVFVGLGCITIFAAGLLYWTGFSDQFKDRFDKLSEQSQSNNIRLDHWTQTSPAIADFMPMGSGVGSYLNVHRLYRSDSEVRVFQHAENQYFQTLVEAGIPGILLLIAAITILILCVRFVALRGNSPKTTAVTLMGIFVVVSQMIAALFDFGLFIPANTVLMAVSCGFLAGQAHSLADRLKKKYVFRFKVPQFVNMAIVLLIFVTSVFGLLSSYRYWQLDKVVRKSTPGKENYVSMDLEATDEQIEELKQAVDRLPDARSLNHLARLYIHRYRMQLITMWCESNGIVIETSSSLDQIWLQTNVVSLHRMINEARMARDQARLVKLTSDRYVKENLMPAVYYLRLSRSRSPLQPEVHLILGQIHGASLQANADVPHINRGMELSPANSMTAFLAGVLHLQANRKGQAAKAFKECLRIEPKNYNRVSQVAIAYLPAERVVEILPDDPLMLWQFATTYLAEESSKPLKLDVYERINSIYDDRDLRDRKSLRSKVEVQIGLGDTDGAIETLGEALILYPEVKLFHRTLIQLLRDKGDFEGALETARSLGRLPDEKENAAKLIRQIMRQMNEPN